MLTHRSLWMLLLGAVTLGASSGVSEGQALPGWYATGSHPSRYAISPDRQVVHQGKASCSIASRPPAPQGFMALYQKLEADAYRGKRVRLSGYVRARDVKESAGLWMRLDGEFRQLALDNMMDRRRITGTRDWKQYQIVLDVPDETEFIVFGVLLGFEGQIWIDDFRVDIVGSDVPTTRLNEAETQDSNIVDPEERRPAAAVAVKVPRNLDFEEPPTAKTQ